MMKKWGAVLIIMCVVLTVFSGSAFHRPRQRSGGLPGRHGTLFRDQQSASAPGDLRRDDRFQVGGTGRFRFSDLRFAGLGILSIILSRHAGSG